MIKYVSTFGLILGLLCGSVDAAKKHQDDCDVPVMIKLAQDHAQKFLTELHKQPSSWSCVGAAEVSGQTLEGLSNFWWFNEHTSRSKGHFPKDAGTEAERDIYRAAFIWETNKKLQDHGFKLFFGKTRGGKHKIFVLETKSVPSNGTTFYTRDTLESVNLNSDMLWNNLPLTTFGSTSFPYNNETLTLYPAEAFITSYLGTSDAQVEDQWAFARSFFPNLEEKIQSSEFDSLDSVRVNTANLKQILLGTLSLQNLQGLKKDLLKAIDVQKEEKMRTAQESTEALQDMVLFAINLTQAQEAKSRS